MRKRISSLIFLILILTIGLVGCKGNKGVHSNHEYGEWELTRKATCAAPGIETRTCECGEKETRELEKLAHTEEIIEGVEPTCTTTGKTEGSRCSVCDQVIQKQKILPEAHKEEKLKAIAATCTRAGKGEGTKCSLCGEIVTRQKKIRALGHDYKNGSCTKCKKMQPDVIVSFSIDNMHDRPPASFITKKAYPGGTTISFWAFVPEKADWWSVNWTTDKNDVDIYTAWAGGGKVMNVEKGSWQECNVTLPDDEKEYYVYLGGAKSFWSNQNLLIDDVTITDKSGKVIGTDDFNNGIDAGLFNAAKVNQDTGMAVVYEKEGCSEHTIVTDKAIAPTCDETGKKEGSHCSSCGKVFKVQEVVPALGHKWVNNVCKVCGKEREDLVAVLVVDKMNASAPMNFMTKESYPGGSTISFSVYTPIIQLANGNYTWWGVSWTTDPSQADLYTCWSGTGEPHFTSEGGAWKDYTVTLPDDGQEYYIYFVGAESEWSGKELQINNFVVKDSEGKVIAEDSFDDGVENGLFDVIEKEPGTGQIVVYDRVIEIPCKDGHTTVTDKGYEPTCTEPGLTDGSHCSVCGVVLVPQESIPATGHDYGEEGKCSCGETLKDRAVAINVDALYEVETMNFITREAYAGGSTISFKAFVPVGTAWWTISYTTNPAQTSIYAWNDYGTGSLQPSSYDQWQEYSLTLPDDGNTYYFYITGAKSEWGGKELLIDNVKITNAAGQVIATDDFNNGIHSGIFNIIEDGRTIHGETPAAVREYIIGDLCMHPASKHVKENDIEATCTDTGIIGRTYCSACGETLIEEEVVPALGHDYEDGTCTECGDKQVNKAMQIHMEYQNDDPTNVVTKNAYFGGKMTFEAFVPEGITGETGWWGVAPTTTQTTSIYTIAGGYALNNDEKLGKWAEYEVAIPNDGKSYYLAIGGATGTNGNDWAGKQLLIDNVKIYDANGTLVAEEKFGNGFADSIFNVNETGKSYIHWGSETAVDLFAAAK